MENQTVKTFITFVLCFFIGGVVFAQSQKKLNPTIYFVKTINLEKQDCSLKKTLISTSGKAIKKVCANDYKTCVIEGTCALVGDETKVINYVDQKQGVPVFEEVNEKCPYGYGVKNICLDPYYTVAADLTFHKPGEVIFLEDVKGTKLPNGEVHDGFFIVRDKGGAIKGANRFDFYTGLLHYKNEENPFTPIGLASEESAFKYRVATPEEAAAVKERRNYPGLPQ